MKPIAVVTGSSKGIGLAIAQSLFHDYDVIGISRTYNEQFPGTLILADLSLPTERQRVFEQIAEKSDVQVLVNNLGFNELQPLGQISIQDYQKIIDLNVTASLDATQYLLPSIRRAGNGRIINMGARAMLGRPNSSVYAAAKAAIVGFTRSWALELASEGITVNCVSPGPVETEMLARNVPKGSAYRNRVMKTIPLQRFGQPDEVASLVKYLISASFITGQTINICGGSSISFSEL